MKTLVRVSSVSFAVVALLVGRNTLAGQDGLDPNSAGRSATIALVDSLPHNVAGYDAIILRRSGGGDVILLLKGSSSPEILLRATRVLMHSRLALGLAPTEVRGRPFQVITLGVAMDRQPSAGGDKFLPEARRLYDQLQDAPSRTLPGVGFVPATMFTPPEPTRRPN